MKMIDHYQVFLKDGSNLFEMSMSRKGKIRHVEFGHSDSLFLIVENRPDNYGYVIREFMLVYDADKLDSNVKYITTILGDGKHPTSLLYEVLPS